MNNKRIGRIFHHINPKREPKLYEPEEDIIASYMVNKIISLTITRIFKEKVDNQLSEKIFSSFITIIDSYINSQFISIDKDEEINKIAIINFKEENDEKEKLNEIKKTNTLINLSNENLSFDFTNLFYNNYYRGENEWNLINEPKSNEKDRFCSSMANNKILNDNIDKIEEENLLTKNNFYNKNIHSSQNNLKNKLHFHHQNNKLSIDNRNKKKNLAEIMNKFSYYDLNYEDFEDKESDFIKALRTEREEELKLFERERKIKLKTLKKLEEKKKEEDNFKKFYENKKITIDPNGNIVLIKGIKAESLSKEFISIKTNLKMLKTEKSKYDIIEKTKKEENEIKENKKQEKKENNEKEKNENKRNVIKVNENKKINNLIIKSGKRNSNSFDNLTIESLSKKIEKGPITPSGSCFDKINLEVGVSIKENKKFKTGGKDFFLKYKKYSMENYNKKLKDTLNINFLKTHSNFNFNNNDDLTNLENLNNSNNLNNTNTNNFNYNNYNISNSNNNNSKELSALYKKTNLTLNNILKKTDSILNPSIKLNGISTLKTTINDLDILEDKEIINQKIHRRNIFKDKIVNMTTLKKLPKKLYEMDDFAAALVTSDRWKENSSKRKKLEPIKIPNKPLQKEIDREIGKGSSIIRKRKEHYNVFSKSMKNFGLNLRSYSEN